VKLAFSSKTRAFPLLIKSIVRHFSSFLEKLKSAKELPPVLIFANPDKKNERQYVDVFAVECN